MAAVRCAARRLGGSLLQRTQAAVAEEGRLLAPSRLMRSRELSTKVSGQPTQGAIAQERRRLPQSRLMRSHQLSSELVSLVKFTVKVRSREAWAHYIVEWREYIDHNLRVPIQHAHEHSTRQAQQTVVELHDALSKDNGKHLSAQATRRPFDPMRWQVYSERARGVLDLACKVTFFVYGGAFLLGITGTGKMLGLAPELSEDKIKK